MLRSGTTFLSTPAARICASALLVTLGIARVGAGQAGGIGVSPPHESAVPQVVVGGEKVGALDLNVAAPGWGGKVLTFSRSDSPQSSEDGAAVTGSFIGASGPLAKYTWRSVQTNTGVDVELDVTPLRPIQNEVAMLVLSIPMDSLDGKPWVTRNFQRVQEGVFGPRADDNGKKLVRDYRNGTFAWCLADGSYLRLRPDADSIAMWVVQDNRAYGDDGVEIQLQRIRQETLPANQTFTMSVGIEHITAEQAMGPDPRLTEERAAKIRLVVPDPPRYVDNRAPALAVTTPPSANLNQGELAEWSLEVAARYENPFDPRQVRVDLEVRTPSGAVRAVPGYFAAHYTRELEDGREVLRPAGEPGWAVRYRPDEPGEHHWSITLADGDQVVSGGAGTLTVNPHQTPGNIRISPRNPEAFAFENGKSYIPIGLNLAWPGRRGTLDYDKWFDAMEANGVNFARLWLAPDFNTLSFERPELGPGQLDMTSAWALDYIVREAERRGIYLMLCIDAHGNLSTSVNPAWHENPYSTLNGGTAKRPMDFWTDPESRRRAHDKLRYLVARYGDSPAVFAWEFWNEVTLSDQSGNYHGPIRDWHREMGRALRKLDVYDHLVTTSTASGGHISLLDTLPEIDFVQTHSYSTRDLAATVRTLSEMRTSLLAKQLGEQDAAVLVKPHLFGEMGTGHRPEVVAEDADGVHLHNMIWAGLMTPTPGTAMSWWWDKYIEKYDLWHVYRVPAEFMAQVPAAAGPTRAITGAAFSFADPPDSPNPRPLAVSGTQASWGRSLSNRPQWLTIHPDGRVDGLGYLSRVLHGVGEEDSHYNPVTFAVSYPVAGTFSVDVEGVSGWGGAGLKVFLNHELLLDEDFADPDGREIKGVIQSYNGRYSIEVPAGDHAIRVENHGVDWVAVRYEFDGATSDAYPWLDVSGVVVEGAADEEPAVLLWIRSRDYVWSRAVEGLPVTPVPPSVLDLEGLPDGVYRVELWDTRTGDHQNHGTVSAIAGNTRLLIPEVERDLAARLIRTNHLPPEPSPDDPKSVENRP